MFTIRAVDIRTKFLGAAFLLALVASIFLALASRTLPSQLSLIARGFVRHPDAKSHVWFVDSSSGERFFVGSGADLLSVVRASAVGASAADVAGVPPAVVGDDGRADGDGDGVPDDTERLLGTDPFAQDTDADGQTDGAEIADGADPRAAGAPWPGNRRVINRLRGRLILDVTHGGSVWYVSLSEGRRYHLGSGEDAYRQALRLASPISDELLRDVPVAPASPSWLQVPEGYRADIAATGFVRPRVLALDPRSRLVVSDFGEKSRVLVLSDKNGDGRFETQKALLRDLFNGHGIAFIAGRLYVAKEHWLEYWRYDAERVRVMGNSRRILALPGSEEQFAGQGHKTRTVVAGSDGLLRLSIGSLCDHCVTKTAEAHAVVKRLDLEASQVAVVGTGLRNTVFLVEHPDGGEWWGNDMGMDSLGDDLPPDELNVIREGDYGWPYCYDDKVPVPGIGTPERCAATISPAFTYPAHSAPLGLRFVPAGFNAEWAGDMMSALHGSTVKKGSLAGYKIVRVQMDGHVPSASEDAITGFLRDDSVVVGRPVDLLFSPAGDTLYVTDDFARVVHAVRRVR